MEDKECCFRERKISKNTNIKEIYQMISNKVKEVENFNFFILYIDKIWELLSGILYLMM